MGTRNLESFSFLGGHFKVQVEASALTLQRQKQNQKAFVVPELRIQLRAPGPKSQLFPGQAHGYEYTESPVLIGMDAQALLPA